MAEGSGSAVAYLGIDVGKRTHSACALDEGGAVVFRADVENRPGDVDRLLGRAGAGALVVVDQKRNIGALVPARAFAHGNPCAYLPGYAERRARGMFPGIAKTDAIDAEVIARTARGIPGALGIEAVRAGREVRFVDCARLVEDLEDASSRGILKKRLKYYAHSRLLIIDELGYLDVGSAGADLLFQLISTRYEQRSTIITTNVGISGWGRVFGDDVAASAIADRVCHHCHLVKITGRSYRLKDLPRDGPVKP